MDLLHLCRAYNQCRVDKNWSSLAQWWPPVTPEETSAQLTKPTFHRTSDTTDWQPTSPPVVPSIGANWNVVEQCQPSLLHELVLLFVQPVDEKQPPYWWTFEQRESVGLWNRHTQNHTWTCDECPKNPEIEGDVLHEPHDLPNHCKGNTTTPTQKHIPRDHGVLQLW